ncbi:MAG: hypothetical protein U7123_20350 [Potamolinea sp.]
MDPSSFLSMFQDTYGGVIDQGAIAEQIKKINVIYQAFENMAMWRKEQQRPPILPKYNPSVSVPRNYMELGEEYYRQPYG